MDKIDKKILFELMEDPQVPFLTIAEKMRIAPVTVQARFEKMKKKGVIQATTTLLNLNKIGFQGKAFLYATASAEYHPKETIEAILKIPNVYLISEIVGKYDLMIILVFKNIRELRKIINKIRALNSIERVDVALNDEAIFPLKEEYTQLRLL